MLVGQMLETLRFQRVSDCRVEMTSGNRGRLRGWLEIGRKVPVGLALTSGTSKVMSWWLADAPT
jgi:hypothetical protein